MLQSLTCPLTWLILGDDHYCIWCRYHSDTSSIVYLNWMFQPFIIRHPPVEANLGVCLMVTPPRPQAVAACFGGLVSSLIAFLWPCPLTPNSYLMTICTKYQRIHPTVDISLSQYESHCGAKGKVSGSTKQFEWMSVVPVNPTDFKIFPRISELWPLTMACWWH